MREGAYHLHALKFARYEDCQLLNLDRRGLVLMLETGCLEASDVRRLEQFERHAPRSHSHVRFEMKLEPGCLHDTIH
jgi:hypothetical protein